MNFTSDKNGNLIEIATRNSLGWEYRYESPIGDTEPTGLQAAARLQGELNAKLANLVLAATTAAGHLTILNEIASQWVKSDTARFPLYAALDARDELLKAIQELGNA